MSTDYIIQLSVTVRVTDEQQPERAQLASEEATPLDETMRRPEFSDDAEAVAAHFLSDALAPALETAVRHIPGGKFIGWRASAHPITYRGPTDPGTSDAI